MAVYRKMGKDGEPYGAYLIDRRLLGRRLKVSTRTTRKKTAQEIDRVLDELVERQLNSRLLALLNGEVTLQQLYEMKERGTLLNPRDDTTLHQLEATLMAWAENYSQWTEKTRKDHLAHLATLFQRVPPTTGAAVTELPMMMVKYRMLCEKAGTARTFNKVRTIINRFLRVSYGRTSPTYIQAVEVEKLRETPKRKTQPLSPARIDKLCAHLPPEVAAMVWTMTLTGAGWNEYGTLEDNGRIKNPRIAIKGTKMDHKDGRRDRIVPRVRPPAPRVGTERAFQKILKATGERLKLGLVLPYSFRKCYANWCAESGIPQWRVEMYMGHIPKSQTSKYQATDEIWRFVRDDAKRLREWVDKEKTKKGLRPS
jgi:integrase